MSEQENRSLARRFVDEVWNAGNLDVLDQIITPNYVHHDPSLQEFGSGIEGFKRYVDVQRKAFPDLEITLEDQIASDDKVVDRWTGRGTQQGELMGLPPTDRHVVATGITIHRIADGKIAETWNVYDALGMLRQLGAL